RLGANQSRFQLGIGTSLGWRSRSPRYFSDRLDGRKASKVALSRAVSRTVAVHQRCRGSLSPVLLPTQDVPAVVQLVPLALGASYGWACAGMVSAGCNPWLLGRSRRRGRGSFGPLGGRSGRDHGGRDRCVNE